MAMQNYHLINRPNRELTSEADIQEILKKGKFVVISMCRDNEPYIVTLSYGFSPENNTMYFHCAKQGMKLELIAFNPSVCATVIEDGGYVSDQCEHNYKTAVFRGTMSIVTDLDEKRYGMSVLVNHLESAPEAISRLLLKSDEAFSRMDVLKLEIKQITAKAGK
jgi:nitroimidazol reductase NimA-like FMN-containing flavoprotein (pyridoxamine 5'-phosphate oxidase superfamily)